MFSLLAAGNSFRGEWIEGWSVLVRDDERALARPGVRSGCSVVRCLDGGFGVVRSIRKSVGMMVVIMTVKDD